MTELTYTSEIPEWRKEKYRCLACDGVGYIFAPNSLHINPCIECWASGLSPEGIAEMEKIKGKDQVAFTTKCLACGVGKTDGTGCTNPDCPAAQIPNFD